MHARLKASVHPPATARLKEAQAATYGSLVEAGGNASLHKEAAKGDADAIRALVAAGADVNAPDKMDATPLVWAAIGGHVGAIRALIEAGAEVNARPNTIDPPLHFAALHDNAEAIRALVEAGAEVNAKVGRGTAALHLASGAGGADAALALIEAGNGTTNVNVKGPSDSTPLHDAATHNNAAAIRVLADAGGDVDARENGCNAAPLHWAAQWCHVEAVRALIEAGAEVNARSSLGATPLGIAIGVGWPEGVFTLRGVGGRE